MALNLTRKLITDGELTDAGMELVKLHVETTKADGPCSACGGSEWSLNDHVMRSYCLKIGGSFIPIVMLECDKCGHFRQFSAYAVGLRDAVKEYLYGPE